MEEQKNRRQQRYGKDTGIKYKIKTVKQNTKSVKRGP